jgi:nucleotide-binding universal stress UspA family protein
MNEAIKYRFQTILVATDFGENASAALQFAQALARSHKARIVIMHVIDPASYAFPNGIPASLALGDEASREIQRMEEETRRQGIAVHSQVQTGMICERILQSLKETHADLLILGTRARGHAGRAALGTVARHVLAQTPCPMLTVSREMMGHLPHSGCWQRVLVATDFSVASLEALDFAHRITLNLLTIVHAEPCLEHHEGEPCLERLRFLAPFNESHTVPVEHVVKAGDAAAVIVSQAQKTHADLVVLGSPADELSGKDFESSTVLQVISAVNCPVLCVPSTLRMPLAALAKEVAEPC